MASRYEGSDVAWSYDGGDSWDEVLGVASLGDDELDVEVPLVAKFLS